MTTERQKEMQKELTNLKRKHYALMEEAEAVRNKINNLVDSICVNLPYYSRDIDLIMAQNKRYRTPPK